MLLWQPRKAAFPRCYEYLLARPVARALLAHDAGAGKTIMAGLLIYPERSVKTRPYHISRAESHVLEAVQSYAKVHYQRAQSTSQSAAFALLNLERRLTSNPYALRESLRRMRERVQERLADHRVARHLEENAGEWAVWEELTERERWAREARAERAATDILSPRQLNDEARRLDDLMRRPRRWSRRRPARPGRARGRCWAIAASPKSRSRSCARC